jgi:hypothetical protein
VRGCRLLTTKAECAEREKFYTQRIRIRVEQ